MRKSKGIIISILVILILSSSIVSAESLYKDISVIFDSVNLQVNGEDVEVTNFLYDGLTYTPINKISEMLGKKISVDEETNTISINDPKPYTIDEDFIIHGIYAIKSYDQYSDFDRSRTLSNFDSISFGWSRIDKKDNELKLLLSGDDSQDYYIPSGYNETLDTANRYNISKQLMIYADSSKEYYFNEIFEKKEDMVDQIMKVVDGENSNFSMLEFNGVTIDFETVKEKDQIEFVDFLKLLKEKLGDKKLYVAVPSVNYYDHYHFKDIVLVADYMIIMEHDFDDKKLEPGYIGENVVKTPLSPINKIEDDINTLISKVGQENSDKILLQLSFDTTQWGVKNGMLHTNSGDDGVIEPSNPTYEKIYDRINKEIDEKHNKLNELVDYDEKFENPYMHYYNEDDKIEYYIWYENSRSVIEKIKLAQKYNLAGISLWRIGTIPNYYGENGEEVGFDVWNKINDMISN